MKKKKTVNQRKKVLTEQEFIEHQRKRKEARQPPAKRGRGRPRAEINWTLIDNLCAIHATGNEIAAVLGISVDTLERRCEEFHDVKFADYIKEKRKKGKVSLRRMQWKAAESGDRTMLVWLGKNWLKQTDRLQQKTEVSGTIGPIMIPCNKRDE